MFKSGKVSLWIAVVLLIVAAIGMQPPVWSLWSLAPFVAVAVLTFLLRFVAHREDV